MRSKTFFSSASLLIYLCCLIFVCANGAASNEDDLVKQFTLPPSAEDLTQLPTILATSRPSQFPSKAPSRKPTRKPTRNPTDEPTQFPTLKPTKKPTNSPTKFPTVSPTYMPTPEPTNRPTPKPTACTASCPTGTYNMQWRTDSSFQFCRSNDLVCSTCPNGFYKEDGSIFTSCLPCSDSSNGLEYCKLGKKLTRNPGNCTYYSKATRNTLDFYDGDLDRLEDWMIRDSDGPCGNIAFDSSTVEVEVVQPTSTYFSVTLRNTGAVSVRLNKWIIPNYIKFYDEASAQTIEDFSVIVPAMETLPITFVVESSGISVEFQNNQPVHIQSTLKFTQVQEFNNNGEPNAVNREISIPLDIEVIPPSVSILPDEYSVSVAFNSVTDHIFTIYSANYNRVDWSSTVLYDSFILSSTVNWLTLSPSAGTFLGYSCRNNDIVSNGQNSDHSTIVATVDSRGLTSGDYSATILISNGYRNVQAKIKITVDPGILDVGKSSAEFEQVGGNEASENADGTIVLNLPYTSLRIIPRDFYGTVTTEGVLDTTFRAVWKSLEDSENEPGFIDIDFDEFENEFSGILDIPKTGLYEIAVIDSASGEHMYGSPFNVSYLSRECTEIANSIADPITGKTCICSEGYGKEAGSNTCSQCSAGTYRAINTIYKGVETCEPCPPGTYQDETGAGACKICSGRAQPNTDRTGCNACRGNEVVNVNTAFRLCEPCGTGFTVIGEECQCRVDFYDGGNQTCLPCPNGAFCGYGDISTIYPLQGYWQSAWDRLEFLKCREERACRGITRAESIILSTTEGWEAFMAQRERRILSENASTEVDPYSGLDVPNMTELSSCAQEYTGPLCYECAPGYFKTSAGECTACGDYLGSVFVLLSLILLGLAALIYLIRRSIRSKRATRRKEVMVLKIVISHMQVVALVKGFPFSWPPALLAMFALFDTLSSAGSSALSLNCLLDVDGTGNIRSFIVVSLVYWFLPIFFLLSFATFWFVLYPKAVESERCDCIVKADESNTKSNLTLMQCFLVSNIVLLFVLHPLLTSAGLRFFSCTSVSSRSFLEAEFTLECFVGEHLEWIWLGATMIVMYAIGIPLFGTMILACIVRPGLKNKSESTSQVYGFLFGGYREDCLYWEIVIMIRKALFAVIAVVLKNVGVDIQAYLGLLVIVLSWLLHTHFQPYNKSLNLDWLEAASLAVTFSTLFAGMFLVSENAPTVAKEIASTFIVVANILFMICSTYSIRTVFHSSFKHFIHLKHQWYSTATTKSVHDDTQKLDGDDSSMKKAEPKIDQGIIGGSATSAKSLNREDSSSSATSKASVRLQSEGNVECESPAQQEERVEAEHALTRV